MLSDRKVKFLCCEQAVSALCGESANPDEFVNVSCIDTEGFLVCPKHGGRRYGWRSPRMKLYRVIDKETGLTDVKLVAIWGESDIERDRFIQSELFMQQVDAEIAAANPDDFVKV